MNHYHFTLDLGMVHARNEEEAWDSISEYVFQCLSDQITSAEVMNEVSLFTVKDCDEESCTERQEFEV